jgi:hypothetical protein
MRSRLPAACRRAVRPYVIHAPRCGMRWAEGRGGQKGDRAERGGLVCASCPHPSLACTSCPVVFGPLNDAYHLLDWYCAQAWSVRWSGRTPTSSWLSAMCRLMEGALRVSSPNRYANLQTFLASDACSVPSLAPLGHGRREHFEAVSNSVRAGIYASPYPSQVQLP